MIRIAHLSDLHVTEGPRLGDHRDTLAAVVDEALGRGVDLWMITGDLYGHTVPHRSTPAERDVLMPEVARMAQVAPVVIVQGNHDHTVDVLGLEHLDSNYKIRVYTGAATEQIVTPAGPVSVYALPYPTKRWLLAGDDVPGGVVASQAAVQEKLAMLIRIWAMRIKRNREAWPHMPHIFAGHFQVRGSTVGAGVVLAGQEIELTTGQLDALPVDYGALGHLHDRQETAERYWYAGSLWNTAHSRQRRLRSWNMVHVYNLDDTPRGEPETRGWHNYKSDRYRSVGSMLGGNPATGRMRVQVWEIPSPCREFVTLDYRWSQPEGEAAPRWTAGPACGDGPQWPDGMKGAEVRARLTVPAQHVTSCPWAAEIELIKAHGAHRIIEERIIEPVLRVRSPEVAAAKTLPDKLRAYWASLATPPTAEEQDAALLALAELEQDEDETIRAATAKIGGVA